MRATCRSAHTHLISASSGALKSANSTWARPRWCCWKIPLSSDGWRRKVRFATVRLLPNLVWARGPMAAGDGVNDQDMRAKEPSDPAHGSSPDLEAEAPEDGEAKTAARRARKRARLTLRIPD